MRHGGSVMAPDAELADALRPRAVRPAPGERPAVDRAPRRHRSTCDDPDLLQPPLDRSFKKPGGYVMRDKLAAARAGSRPGEAEGARPK